MLSQEQLRMRQLARTYGYNYPNLIEQDSLNTNPEGGQYIKLSELSVNDQFRIASSWKADFNTALSIAATQLLSFGGLKQPMLVRAKDNGNITVATATGSEHVIAMSEADVIFVLPLTSRPAKDGGVKDSSIDSMDWNVLPSGEKPVSAKGGQKIFDSKSGKANLTEDANLTPGAVFKLPGKDDEYSLVSSDDKEVTFRGKDGSKYRLPKDKFQATPVKESKGRRISRLAEIHAGDVFKFVEPFAEGVDINKVYLKVESKNGRNVAYVSPQGNLDTVPLRYSKHIKVEKINDELSMEERKDFSTLRQLHSGDQFWFLSKDREFTETPYTVQENDFVQQHIRVQSPTDSLKENRSWFRVNHDHAGNILVIRKSQVTEKVKDDSNYVLLRDRKNLYEQDEQQYFPLSDLAVNDTFKVKTATASNYQPMSMPTMQFLTYGSSKMLYLVKAKSGAGITVATANMGDITIPMADAQRIKVMVFTQRPVATDGVKDPSITQMKWDVGPKAEAPHTDWNAHPEENQNKEISGKDPFDTGAEGSNFPKGGKID